MPEVALRWMDAKGELKTGGAECLPDCLAADWVWADLTKPTPELIEQFRERFDLHPLVVEDFLHTQKRSKLDIYPAGVFMTWLTPRRRRGDGVVVDELDIMLGAGYLITSHATDMAAIDAVASESERSLRSGADWTLHSIIDLLVNSTLPLIDMIGEELYAIEEAMLDSNPRQEDLRKLHQVRRQLVRLHRIVAPERDVLHALARARDIVSEEAYRYFLDVSDHVARVLDSIETYQDVGASVMDLYLSAQNNRMNAIMKQLTVVATIFMPLTLISGIYGTNLLKGMWPSPDAAWSFAAVIGSMGVLAITMALYFRKKNWW